MEKTISYRKERVAEEIRRVISEKMTRESSNLLPNGFLTINKVVLSPDFSIAKVFYSAFGSAIDHEGLSHTLREHQPEFRYIVAQKLSLKKTPQIRFTFDKNIEYASRIDALLQK